MCSSTSRCHFSGLMSGKASLTKASGSSEQPSNCWTRSSSASNVIASMGINPFALSFLVPAIFGRFRVLHFGFGGLQCTLGRSRFSQLPNACRAVNRVLLIHELVHDLDTRRF